jgi:hypothetical protein
MARKKKTITITLSRKKPATGHQPHRSGSGHHDNRPNRQRTRAAQRHMWEKDH